MNEMKIVFNGDGDYVVLEDEDLMAVNQNFPENAFNWSVVGLTNLVILVVNIIVLVWARIKGKNLVDMMVWMDCLANLSLIGVLFLAYPVRVFDDHSYLCGPIEFYRAFSLIINRSVLYTYKSKHVIDNSNECLLSKTKVIGNLA